MPSDPRNLAMAIATHLMFSLFNIAMAREVPFGILQYIQYVLHGLMYQCPHSSLFTMKYQFGGCT